MMRTFVCAELRMLIEKRFVSFNESVQFSWRDVTQVTICDMCHMCDVSHVTRVMCVTPGLSRQGDNNMTKPLVGTDKEFNYLITIRNDLI